MLEHAAREPTGKEPRKATSTHTPRRVEASAWPATATASAGPWAPGRLLELRRTLGNRRFGALARQLAEPPTLALSTPGDPLEQEADTVADQIAASRGGGMAAIHAPGGAAGAGHTARGRAPVPLGDGEPLAPKVQAFFEPRLGCDLGGVRVHTDRAADLTARSLGAAAFTVGGHVAFGAGRYEPGTAAGRRLLAHELAHVARGEIGPGVVVRRQALDLTHQAILPSVAAGMSDQELEQQIGLLQRLLASQPVGTLAFLGIAGNLTVLGGEARRRATPSDGAPAETRSALPPGAEPNGEGGFELGAVDGQRADAASQPSPGNGAMSLVAEQLGRLWSQTRSVSPSPGAGTTLQPSPGIGLLKPDLMGSDFNPDAIVNDLRRAIDQSETTAIPKASTAISKASTAILGWWATTEWTIVRSVDAGAVIRALDNLTAGQVEMVKTLYAARENGRSLEKDLLFFGDSGHLSDLTQDQRDRISALLKGTRPDRRGLDPTAGTPGTPDGRLEADAIELHELLAGDLDEAKRERVMALHRRPVDEIDRIDHEYAKRYRRELSVELFQKLDGLQHKRLFQLRNGNWALADACALEDHRRALDALASDPFSAISAHEKRKQLIAGIEGIVEMNRQEAIAANPGMAANQAVQERLGKILGTQAGEPGQTLGDELAKTLGPTTGGAIAAMTNGSLIEAAARRLLEMEATHTTNSEKMAELLRGLRMQAAHDVMARVYDPWVPDSEKRPLADPGTREAKVDAQAKEYVRLFVEAYERHSRNGGGRSYDEIVTNTSEANQDMLKALQKGGGRMTELQELEYAIGKKDVDAIKTILRRQPTKQAVEALVSGYAENHPGRTLRETLFGPFGAAAAESNVGWMRGGLLIGAGAAETSVRWMRGGLLSGRDAASAQESLEKPEQLEGEAEVKWIAEHGQREVEVTEANSGVMGWLRERGDVPETQVIMNESAARLEALQDEWKRGDPWGRSGREILAEMRRVRAALTGDASAYEAENEQMVAELRSAVSLAVQVALAIALPGVGSSLLATAALNIGATVTANMIIYGDQYGWTNLRNDVLGGGLGALGGKLGEEVAGLVAGSTAKTVAAAAERAGLSTKLAKEAGILGTRVVKEGGNLVGSTAGTTVATGENGFTLENLAQGAFLNMLGKVARPAHTPGRGSVPPGDVATTLTPDLPAAAAAKAATESVETAPAPEVASKPAAGMEHEPLPPRAAARKGQPDEHTVVTDDLPEGTVMHPADPTDAAAAQQMYGNGPTIPAAAKPLTASPSAELHFPGPHPFFKKPAANTNALLDAEVAVQQLAMTGTGDVAGAHTVDAPGVQGAGQTNQGAGGMRMGPKPSNANTAGAGSAYAPQIATPSFASPEQRARLASAIEKAEVLASGRPLDVAELNKELGMMKSPEELEKAIGEIEDSVESKYAVKRDMSKTEPRDSSVEIEGTHATGDTTRNRSSRASHEQVLGRGMEEESGAIPLDHDRHHVAPKAGGGQLGNEIRKELLIAGVSVDDPANSAPLAGQARDPRATHESDQAHSRAHTRARLRNLLDDLRTVHDDADDVRAVLRKHGHDVYEGEERTGQEFRLGPDYEPDD
jgi:hypothetical protein